MVHFSRFFRSFLLLPAFLSYGGYAPVNPLPMPFLAAQVPQERPLSRSPASLLALSQLRDELSSGQMMGTKLFTHPSQDDVWQIVNTLVGDSRSFNFVAATLLRESGFVLRYTLLHGENPPEEHVFIVQGVGADPNLKVTWEEGDEPLPIPQERTAEKKRSRKTITNKTLLQAARLTETI